MAVMVASPGSHARACLGADSKDLVQSC